MNSSEPLILRDLETHILLHLDDLVELENGLVELSGLFTVLFPASEPGL